MPHARPELPDRFRVESLLGEGAFGVVYAVTDTQSESRLALKALRRGSRMDVVAFKREFRVLRALHHPNLVRLDELFEHQGELYFTMELVDGADFSEHVGVREPWSEARERRVRETFRDIAEAVAFAHRAHKVHRDIKPSNVRVRRDGRVVLLDFGIAADLDHDVSDEVVGTPEYMAPEQALGEPITPAADWYAVGAMLHTALVGRPPFTGSLNDVLSRKVVEEVVFPRHECPDVPPDLAALCEALLRLDPARRATADQVMAALAARRTGVRTDGVELVGREGELGRLRAAFLDAVGGARRALLIEGASGLGKTALATELLRSIVRANEAIVLKARCHESESVPYKGLDPLVDDLATLLDRADPRVDVVQSLEATDVLAGVFSALRGGRRPSSQANGPRTKEQLLQAFAEVMSALSRSTPVVLFVDDLQWVDSDSLEALATLFTREQPGCLLLLGTARPRPEGTPPWPLPFETLAITELSHPAAEAMARSMGCDSARLPAVLDQAKGHPFFLMELLRAQDPDAPTMSLDELVRARVGALGASCRRLLEVVSVAELPTSLAVLARASDLTETEARRAFDGLERANLARGTGHREVEIVPYHDRVREPVVGALSADTLAATHRALGAALEEHGADAERLLRHHLGAGDDEKARESAMRAGKRASEVLAFDKAVRLYELALRLSESRGPEARAAVVPHLAEALSGARRAGEAARYFAEAVRSAPPELRLDLERRAGEELCHAGFLDEGMAYLRRVTRALGAPMSTRPWVAVLVGGLFRLHWLLRLVLAPPRRPRDVDARVLRRLDAYYTVAATLSHVDTVAASEFSARQVSLCMRVGEPYHLSKAMSLEAAFIGTLGGRFLQFARYMMRRSRTLVASPPRYDALGFHAMATAFLSFFAGDLDEAIAEFDDVVQHYGIPGYLDQRLHDLAILWRSVALLHRGDLESLGARMEAWRKDADERSDVHLTLLLDGGEANAFYLLTAGADEARARLDRARRLWLRGAFTMHHLMGAFAEITRLLYEERGEDALRVANEMVAQCRRAILFAVIPYARARVTFLHGCALVAASTAMGDERLARRALRSARALERIDLPLARATAPLLRGAAASALGRPAQAKGAFTEAALAARASGLILHEGVARLRKAQLEGHGAAVEAAMRDLSTLGVLEPLAAAAALAPMGAKSAARPAPSRR